MEKWWLCVCATSRPKKIYCYCKSYFIAQHYGFIVLKCKQSLQIYVAQSWEMCKQRMNFMADGSLKHTN